MRTGIVDLPLHYGKVPRWLFSKMKTLAREVIKVIVTEYSPEEFLRRISNPYWFQSFGCLLGFDWHSSGLTTVTVGAIREGIKDIDCIGITGGKGKKSKETLKDIEIIGEKFNLSTRKIEKLKEASIIIAKVDNSCIQDGFSLYFHSMIIDEKGDFAIIQQGMFEDFARRYHWLSLDIKEEKKFNYFNEKEKVASDIKREKVLNLASKKSEEARKVIVDIVNDGLLLRKSEQRCLKEFLKGEKQKQEYLSFPKRHFIRKIDLSRRTLKILKEVSQIKVDNFKELLKVKGVGKDALRALALTANLIYGTPLDWRDPVKYSFAHGGKDKVPFPIKRRVYINTILNLKEIAEKIEKEKFRENALKRLNKMIEKVANEE